jgi:hypothetical protein
MEGVTAVEQAVPTSLPDHQVRARLLWSTWTFSGGAEVSHTFTAPDARPVSTANAETYLTEAAFPDLEYEISADLTFYLQQALHGSYCHCLYGAYPNVSVDIDPVTLQESENLCSR